MNELLRLILTPDPTVRVDPPTSSGRHVRFIATLDGDFVVLSDQPLVDGARELLKRGFDPAELLTMRHRGSAHDSFEPLPIGQWAKVTYYERDKGRLASEPWKPRAAPTDGQKSPSEPPAGTSPHPEDNSLPVTDRGGK